MNRSTSNCRNSDLVVVMLLLNRCLLVLPLFVESLFCYAVLSVLSSFVVILTRKRELFALL